MSRRGSAAARPAGRRAVQPQVLRTVPLAGELNRITDQLGRSPLRPACRRGAAAVSVPQLPARNDGGGVLADAEAIHASHGRDVLAGLCVVEPAVLARALPAFPVDDPKISTRREALAPVRWRETRHSPTRSVPRGAPGKYIGWCGICRPGSGRSGGTGGGCWAGRRPAAGTSRPAWCPVGWAAVGGAATAGLCWSGWALSPADGAIGAGRLGGGAIRGDCSASSRRPRWPAGAARHGRRGAVGRQGDPVAGHLIRRTPLPHQRWSRRLTSSWWSCTACTATPPPRRPGGPYPAGAPR